MTWNFVFVEDSKAWEVETSERTENLGIVANTTVFEDKPDKGFRVFARCCDRHDGPSGNLTENMGDSKDETA